MIANKIFRLFFVLSAILLLIFSTVIFACTGIQLKAKDGSYVNGRSVEFGINLDLGVLIVPRHYIFKGVLPDGSTGLTYQAKYAAIGANTFGYPAIVDGVNEKGLSVGMFYFPGYAEYASVTPENKNRALSPIDFPNWILTQFSTVDEAKKGMSSIFIAPTAPQGWGGVPPFHYIVYDKSGKSIVIEPIKGQLKVYDNPIGVITNSPTFDWHLTNLANYINLSSINAVPKIVDGLKLQSFGQGSGLHGLPGDFTPPSRFVRAAIFSTSALPVDNAAQAVLQAFHILNQFDIPVGSVRAVENNTTTYDMTIATSVKDPVNLKYYFRTYDDQSIRMADLKTYDWNSKTLKSFSMQGAQTIVDVSKSAVDVS